jgi:hypothetical protein
MKFLFAALIALVLPLPKSAAQSALLIGLHFDASVDPHDLSPPGYRTFLITFHNGKAQLAADVPDLIVPRKNGFWRVGSLYKGSPGAQGGYQELLYAASVGAVPHALGEYDPENPEATCSKTEDATIEFLSPDLISLSYLHEPACSLEADLQHATYKLDDLGKPLDITDVLGPAAWNAEKKADSAAKSAEPGLQDCVIVSKADPKNWAIEGRSRIAHSSATRPWILAGNYNAQHVCNGGDNYEIDFPIPQSITGVEYHADLLSALLKSDAAKKNSISAKSSLLTPGGDFLVLLPYTVFQVENHTVQSKPAFSAPTVTQTDGEFNVVMIQWATGKHVAEWESELKSLAVSKLPEPVIAVGPMQK